MAYVKLRDDFPEHRKVLALSDAAFRLWVTSLCYASRNLTDGAIPRAALARLGGSTKSAGELIAASMWHATPTGFAIHDYLGYQRSRAQVEELNAAAKRRLQRHRNGVSSGVTNADETPDETLHRVTEKQSNKAAAVAAAGAAAAVSSAPPDVLTRCIRAFNGLMGTLAATPAEAKIIGDWMGESAWPYPEAAAESFEDACREAAEHNAKSLKYVLSILRRWSREGRGSSQPEPPSKPTETPEARARREEQDASIREFGRRQRAWDALSPEQKEAERKARSERWREFAAEHGIATEQER